MNEKTENKKNEAATLSREDQQLLRRYASAQRKLERLRPEAMAALKRNGLKVYEEKRPRWGFKIQIVECIKKGWPDLVEWVKGWALEKGLVKEKGRYDQLRFNQLAWEGGSAS